MLVPFCVARLNAARLVFAVLVRWKAWYEFFSRCLEFSRGLTNLPLHARYENKTLGCSLESFQKLKQGKKKVGAYSEEATMIALPIQPKASISRLFFFRALCAVPQAHGRHRQLAEGDGCDDSGSRHHQLHALRAVFRAAHAVDAQVVPRLGGVREQESFGSIGHVLREG